MYNKTFSKRNYKEMTDIFFQIRHICALYECLFIIAFRFRVKFRFMLLKKDITMYCLFTLQES